MRRRKTYIQCSEEIAFALGNLQKAAIGFTDTIRNSPPDMAWSTQHLARAAAEYVSAIQATQAKR